MTKLVRNSIDVFKRLTKERVVKAFSGYENQRADEHTWGSVKSINSDGSYQVQLNTSSVTTRCAAGCTAGVGDRVLVCIMANGRCVAVSRLGGEAGGGNFLPLAGGTMTGNVSYAGEWENDDGTSGTYTNYPIRVAGVNQRGLGVVVGAGGLTIVGGGESGISLYNALIEEDGLTPGSERTYIASDGNIYFARKCNTIANREVVDAWLLAYPVGAVYISYVSTSPASLFGGTWTAITGRFPYFNAGTGTGGSNTHTLTVAQMPSHNHPGGNQYIRATNTAAGTVNSSHGYIYHYAFQDGNSVASQGGGGSHNNMPAYQTLYAWRRTA